MQNPPTVSGTGADYQVESSNPCVYTYQPDSAGNRKIQYDPTTGAVTTLNNN